MCHALTYFRVGGISELTKATIRCSQWLQTRFAEMFISAKRESLKRCLRKILLDFISQQNDRLQNLISSSSAITWSPCTLKSIVSVTLRIVCEQFSSSQDWKWQWLSMTRTLTYFFAVRNIYFPWLHHLALCMSLALLFVVRNGLVFVPSLGIIFMSFLTKRSFEVSRNGNETSENWPYKLSFVNGWLCGSFR